MRAALALALALAVTASASGRERRDPLAGYVPGPPQRCITLSTQPYGPSVVDARTILYREGGRRVWRTGPVGACPALRSDSILIVEVFGGQLCENDRFRVAQPNDIIPSGYCRFTRFTPYTKTGK